MTPSPKSALTQGDPISVARRYYKAYVDKDRAAIGPLIGGDFHFSSPMDNHIDRQTFFARCWPNSENAAYFKFIYLVQDEDRVFVTYEGRGSNRNVTRNTEV